jgi:hypothetical protein
MGTEQEPMQTVRVVKSARPWTGFFLGLVFGIALAVILQQLGVWPLDRLLLFGSAGLFALIGILLGSAGRSRAGALATILPLILAVALIAFGATGLAEVNQNGELNGGCTVQATSSLDSTVVTDTSRQDPFEIDPNGSLSWVATSPAAITNHLWEIYVDIGGFPVVIANNVQPEPNTAGDLENTGDVADVSVYVEEVSNYAGVDLVGVLEVGGSIDGDGGACDGFGFVHLAQDAFSSLIAQIATGIALVALIGLLYLTFSKTRQAEVVAEEAIEDEASPAVVGGPEAEPEETGKMGAHEAQGGAAAAGAVDRPDVSAPSEEAEAPEPLPGEDV